MSSTFPNTRRALRLPRAAATGTAPCTPQSIAASAHWPAMELVQARLVVSIPVRGLCLRDVDQLVVGKTIETEWPSAAELPLMVQGTALSWCEFEGGQNAMTVRLTHLN